MKIFLGDSIKLFYHKITRSITRKILCLIIGAIGASFLASLIVVKKIEKSYSDYVYDTKTELLNSFMAGMEDKLLAYENATYQFITEDRVQGYVSQLLEANSIIDQVEEEMSAENTVDSLASVLLDKSRAEQLKTDSLVGILKELDTYLSSAHRVDAGYFVDQYGKLYKAYGGSKYEMPEEELSRILEGSITASGSPFYSVVKVRQKNGEIKKEIVIARAIREKKNLSMRYCGTVIYLVGPEELAASFLNENSVLVIVDGANDIVFSNMEELEESFLLNLSDSGKKYEMLELQGNKFFVTSLSSPKLDWKYYSVSDYYHLFAFIHNLDILYTVILLLVLLVIGIITSHFSVNLVKPIAILSSRIESIKDNADPVKALSDQGKRKTKKRDDEIGHLEMEFTSMTQRLGELIHENYEQKMYLQDAQLSALRSKLNPHFMYNTLDTIRWMATEESYRQIPMVVKSLGDILRISINSTEPLIPLEQELQYMRGYLMIQRARFGERLNVLIEAEEELMHIRIPAFSIQPLVENAVNYALEQMEKPCMIHVIVKEDGENIYCSVSDNGVGIDPQILDKLNLGTIKAQGNGVGLKNLDERLKSLYGLKYGIVVENNSGGGAIISFKIKREGENEHADDESFIGG